MDGRQRVDPVEEAVVRVEAWDEVFVRTRRPRLNRLVVDPQVWPLWWPRTRVLPAWQAPTAGAGAMPADGGRVVDLLLRPRWPLPQRQHLRVTVRRVRPRDKGVELTLSGDVEGTAEWFHLDEADGVVAHYLLRGEARMSDARARLWLHGHRGSVRRAMTELKLRLEGGRVPGAEPLAALRAHQAREREIFAAEHAVFEAEQALARVEAASGGEAVA